MRKFAFIVAASLMALFHQSCQHEPSPDFTSIRGTVFGTTYTISYFTTDTTNLLPSIDSLFHAFNQSLSYYEENSLISKINRNEIDSTDHFFRTVFKRAMAISEETDGAFDATVSPLVNAWGFGFSKKEEITDALIDSLLQFVGFRKAWLDGHRVVKADERVQFDFNAIAKGYAADVVGDFLASRGVDIYLVEIGGDLVVRGVKPDGSKWRIGLENPAGSMYDEQQWDYYVELEDVGLATSGNYRRYYEVDGMRYAHTINPATGFPVQHTLLSASVFAPDGMSADAYATAFMVMGFEASLEFVEMRDDLEAFFIFADNDGTFHSHATTGLTIFRR